MYIEKHLFDDINFFPDRMRVLILGTFPVPNYSNIEKFEKLSSKEKENVFDGFGGSGSTLIACEQLNRNAYLMELDEKYVQVIIERYIDFTGNDVYRINDDGTMTNWNDIKGE